MVCGFSGSDAFTVKLSYLSCMLLKWPFVLNMTHKQI